jgi:hypothetical protein
MKVAASCSLWMLASLMAAVAYSSQVQSVYILQAAARGSPDLCAGVGQAVVCWFRSHLDGQGAIMGAGS